VAWAIPPHETVRRVRPLLPALGVTRVGEVTHLDRAGVPNFISVRPRDRGPGISYYNGKGTTRAAARAGAMMEAIEHYSGERCHQPAVGATFAAIRRRGPAVDPRAILVPRLRPYRADTRLEWVEGYDLISRRPTWVPLNSVVCPYAPARGEPLYYASTNGLASGNSREEAICHGLCEVIERDAEALALASLALAPAVQRVVAGLGRGADDDRRFVADRFPLIALTRLPAPAAKVVARLRAAGLRVYVRDITSAAGVPTLDCTLVETTFGGKKVAHGGCGAHPDARVALLRALCEAAQSRVAAIQGGREDLPHILRPRRDADPDLLHGRGEVRPFATVRSYEHARIDEDVRFILRRLRAAGFAQAVAVDLTQPAVGIPVVRIVIPNAEAWSVFHLHTERGALGPRVVGVLRGVSA
jgi:ribosomal protein S12 methylthiotransferase accessory factor YcaO